MTTSKHDDKSTLVDPRIAAAWRASSNDEPPASVDAAILAAARREVAAGPEPIDTREVRADRRRWWPLAAAATIAALVVGVLQLTPTDTLDAPATDTAVTSDLPPAAVKPAPSAKVEQPTRGDDAGVRTEARRMDAQRASPAVPPAAPPVPPSVAPLASPAARPSAPSAAPSAETPASTTAAPVEPKQQMAAASPPASPPDPFPAAQKPAADGAAAASGQLAASPPSPPPPLRAEVAANAGRERDSISRADAPPATVATPAPSRTAERASAESAPTPQSAPLAKMAAGSSAESGADEARAKSRTPLPVPDWIALIRRLRAEGKQAEAAKEIAAFRAAHADHEKLLPPDLRDWRPPEN